MIFTNLNPLPVLLPPVLHALGAVDVAGHGLHEAQFGDGSDFVETRKDGGQTNFQGLKETLG